MKVLAEALAPIEQKKAILYFSSGMSRSGSDNQVELRAVINAANKANTSIYPVDSRGLTAVVPGGAAGGGGVAAAAGAAAARRCSRAASMLSQFSSLNASQETLTTLAADTGGQAFIDTNDFGPAFTRVQRDMSAYYLLGYSSTQHRAGRQVPADQREAEEHRRSATASRRATATTRPPTSRT